MSRKPKYGINIFCNAAEARMPNKRIRFVKANGGFNIEFMNIDGVSGGYSAKTFPMRNKGRRTVLVLSDEAMAALAEMYVGYKRHRMLNHNEEEGDLNINNYMEGHG